MLLLQEVKISSKDQKTQDAVRTAINTALPSERNSNSSGPTYEAHFTLPTDSFNARGPRGSGRVYGVCSILRSDLREKHSVNVRAVDWDREGRVSITEIVHLVTGSKLAVFNIYAVNGTQNPYREPSTGQVCGTRHSRKRQFHQLLAQECRDLEEAGWLVLLAGDMNVAPDTRDGFPNLRVFPHDHAVNRADFHTNILESASGDSTGFNGVDVWR